MPLSHCPDCGREVSTRARHCVHCGRPWPAANARIAVLVGMVAALVIAGAAMLLFVAKRHAPREAPPLPVRIEAPFNR